MNALSPIRTYEPVTYAAWSYVMTPADFSDGCFIRTVNGRAYGYGDTRFHSNVTMPLNVPLCRGCDEIIVAGICPDCELVFTGEPDSLPTLSATIGTIRGEPA